MLLVAQRGVTSTGDSINVYYHEHGPRPNWIDELPPGVPYRDPGTLVKDDVTIRGPGNIASFLDIAAPDDTPLDELRRLCYAAMDLLRGGARVPLTIHSGPLMVRLQIESPWRERPPGALHDEIYALFDAAIRLHPEWSKSGE